MRLLSTFTLRFHEFQGESVPYYAILSHTWTDEEVSLQEMKKGDGKDKAGFAKIKSCCALAASEGWEYVWIDTCCIDKSSSVELSEAINSMFQYYRKAAVCYAYLVDVPASEGDHSAVGSTFRQSRWFTRGWTLQELLAPTTVVFYNQGWMEIGTKSSLSDVISSVTRIAHTYMTDLRGANVAVKMSWASDRKTTRIEDIAYCLMGLFGVNMPLLYGEGRNAFIRLQTEILKMCDDETIFAWSRHTAGHAGMLAPSPIEFRSSGKVRQTLFDRERPVYLMTNKGLRMEFQLWQETKISQRYNEMLYLAPLNCTEDPGGDPIAIYLKKVGEDNGGAPNEFARYFPRPDFGLKTMWLTQEGRNFAEQQRRETVYVKQLDHYPNGTPDFGARLFCIRYSPSLCHISRICVNNGGGNWEEREPGDFRASLACWQVAELEFEGYNEEYQERFVIFVSKLSDDSAVAHVEVPGSKQMLRSFDAMVLQELRGTDRISRRLQRGSSVSVAVMTRGVSGQKQFVIDVIVDANGGLPWPASAAAAGKTA